MHLLIAPSIYPSPLSPVLYIVRTDRSLVMDHAALPLMEAAVTVTELQMVVVMLSISLSVDQSVC